jgi:hypothetical protein
VSLINKGITALRRYAPSSRSDVLMSLVGLVSSVFILVAVWLAAAFTVGYMTGSGSATAIAALIATVLLAGLAAFSLVRSRRRNLRGMGAGLGAGGLLALIALVGGIAWTFLSGYGMSSREVAQELAGSVGPENPGLYLGKQSSAGSLVSIEHDGRSLLFRYGRCMEGWGEEGCTPPVEITSEPAENWSFYFENGCKRVRPVLGVPAVVSAYRLTLFTGSSAVSVFSFKRNSEGYIGDTKRAFELATELRPYGESEPVRTLPPPSPETQQVLERCPPPPK